MGLLSLYTGIEFKGVTAAFEGYRFHVDNQEMTDAGRARGFVSNQIVAIKLPAAEGFFKNAKYSNATHLAVAHTNGHLRTPSKDFTHPANIVARQLRTQLAMHGFRPLQPIGLDNVVCCIGNRNNIHVRLHSLVRQDDCNALTSVRLS